MSNAKPELLPCPFCDGTDIRYSSRTTGHGSSSRTLQCRGCWVELEEGLGGGTLEEKWNRRASPAKPPAAVLRDAERYRWLRDEDSMPGVLCSDARFEKYFNEYMICGEQMDKAIDAVMLPALKGTES